MSDAPPFVCMRCGHAVNGTDRPLGVRVSAGNVDGHPVAAWAGIPWLLELLLNQDVHPTPRLELCPDCLTSPELVALLLLPVGSAVSYAEVVARVRALQADLAPPPEVAAVAAEACAQRPNGARRWRLENHTPHPITATDWAAVERRLADGDPYAVAVLLEHPDPAKRAEGARRREARARMSLVP